MAIETIDVVQTSLRKSTDAVPALGSSSIILVERYSGETAEQAVAAANASNSTRRRFPIGGGGFSNLRKKETAAVPTSYDLVNTFGLGPVLPLQDVNSSRGLRQLDKDLFGHCIDEGCNFIQPCFHWHHFEPTTAGVYDWQLIDDLMDFAESRGVYVMAKFLMFRNNDQNRNSDQFIPDSQALTSQDGVVNKAGNATYPSLSSPSVTAHIIQACTAAITRMLSRPSGRRLASVALAYSLNFEGDYTYAGGLGEGLGELYDFGQPAKEAFRAFVLAQWGSRAEVNKQWGTSFSSDAEITTPRFDDNTSPFVLFNTPWKYDFYRFREQAQIDLQQRFHLAAKGVSSKIATVWDSGNFQDNLSRVRGTERAAGSTDHDGIKSNNFAGDPGGYNPYFVAAIGRRQMLSNQFACDEIDCNRASSAEALVNQAVAARRAGVSQLTIWNLFRFGDHNEDVQNQAKVFLSQTIRAFLAQIPMSAPVPRTVEVTMEVKGSEIFQGTWTNAINGGDSLRERFRKLTNNYAKQGNIVIKRTQ